MTADPAWMTSECVEAVARALYASVRDSGPCYLGSYEDERHFFIPDARAALLAAAPFVEDAIQRAMNEAFDRGIRVVEARPPAPGGE